MWTRTEPKGPGRDVKVHVGTACAAMERLNTAGGHVSWAWAIDKSREICLWACGVQLLGTGCEHGLRGLWVCVLGMDGELWEWWWTCVAWVKEDALA